MAISYFNSASNPADNGALSAATVAVTPPVTMLTGDLVLLIADSRTTNETLSVSETGGQSWTSEAARSGNNQTVRLFWCRYNGTWTADPSVTGFTTSGSRPTNVVMHVFRPTDTGKLWALDVAQVSGTFAAPTSPFNVSIAEVTTLTNGALVVAGWACNTSNTWILQTAGWANPGTAQYRNTSGSDISQSFAYKVMATAGGSGAVVNRESAGNAGDYLILAFKEVSIVPNRVVNVITSA